jgi:hypothetical protein
VPANVFFLHPAGIAPNIIGLVVDATNDGLGFDKTEHRILRAQLELLLA